MSKPFQTAHAPSETTSAGLLTEQLAHSSQPKQKIHSVTANTAIAAVLSMLVMLGLLLWYLVGQPRAMPDYLIQATRMTTIDFSASVVWLNLGAWAGFFGLWLRRYILLAGGSIAGGLGIGEVIRQTGMLIETAAIGAWAGGLVLGLLVLYVLGHTVLQKLYRWPLYGALLLAVIGIGIVTTGISLGLAIWLLWIPLLLVSTGVYLGMRPKP